MADKSRAPFNVILVLVLAAIGVIAGYFLGWNLGDEGLEDVYAENWAYVGGGVGFITGLLASRKKKAAAG